MSDRRADKKADSERAADLAMITDTFGPVEVVGEYPTAPTEGTAIAVPTEVTAIGYRLSPKTTKEEWAALWEPLRRWQTAGQWALGDWWLFGERKFGDDAYQYGPHAYASETLQQYAWVCRSVPYEERRPELSFSHHRVVAALDSITRVMLLDRAVAHHWSSRELDDEAKRVRGIKPKADAPR